MKNPLFHQALILIHKDLRREIRTREILTTTIAFALLLVVIFTFAFYQNETTVGIVFPGILWIAIIFAGILAISRTFAQEKENGCLRALALIPHTPQSLFIGKWVVNIIFMIAFEILLLPMLSLAFNVSILSALTGYGLVIFLGTIGFSALGTLLSAMLVHSHLKDVLLPILLYPLLIPLLIVGVKVTAMLYGGAEFAAITPWIQIMMVMDIAYISAGLFLFQWVLSAVE